MLSSVCLLKPLKSVKCVTYIRLLPFVSQGRFNKMLVIYFPEQQIGRLLLW